MLWVRYFRRRRQKWRISRHAAELSIAQFGTHRQIVLSPIDRSPAKPLLPRHHVCSSNNSQEVSCAFATRRRAEITCGNLRVPVVTESALHHNYRPPGETVQRLSLPADEAVHDVPCRRAVLGMGEGAKQFDRRGAKYSMSDGWGAWERPTLGSWVAVPFLVGTDGWAFFVHHPLGEFDLREATATFTPWPDQDDTPLESTSSPGTSRPTSCGVRPAGWPAPLPPKWALGFMQSHRTLQVRPKCCKWPATFRENKLPCDALIYFGTGYCPAGWNTGHASLDFNPATFDKPAEMIDALHDHNFKVVLHVNAPPRG